MLHGLWTPSAAMLPLRRRLEAFGWDISQYAYPSVNAPFADAVAGLRRRLAQHADDPVHLVGHSMGGLVALAAAAESELPCGRIVCVGTPLAGSAVARMLASHPLSAWMVGRNSAVLGAGGALADGREVGMVAGVATLGIGRMLRAFEGEHDGTVALAETRADGLTDHCTVPANHSGLLVSAAAARQVDHFLRHGRFAPPADRA